MGRGGEPKRREEELQRGGQLSPLWATLSLSGI